MRIWNELILAPFVLLALASPACSQTRDAAMMDKPMMEKPMMDGAMMDKDLMMAQREMAGMMGDSKMAQMMAREIMIQEMLSNESMMMAMDKQMMMKPDPQAEKVMANQMAAAKTALTKDKTAMMGMMKEAMLRRMATMKMEKMHQPMMHH